MYITETFRMTIFVLVFNRKIKYANHRPHHSSAPVVGYQYTGLENIHSDSQRYNLIFITSEHRNPFIREDVNTI